MFDKPVNQAPLGNSDNPSGPELEIEVEMPADESGGVVVNLDGSTDDSPGESGDDFTANLALHMDPADLESLAGDLIEDYENDLNSRKDWEDAYGEGLKLLGLKYEQRSEPWDNACGTTSPILTEAVVRFQSETIMETFPASGPVMTKVIGKKTPEKDEAARRVKEDMNHQITDVMVEYRPEHEKMLWNLPIAGSAFKKVYYDSNMQRPVSLFVPAEDMVIPYGVSEIFSAYRITQRSRKTPNEVKRLQDSGFYIDTDLGDPVKDIDDIQKKKDDETGFTATYDDRFQFLEMQVELNLKGFEHKDADGKESGIMLPYVVTLCKDKGCIVAIYRNWIEDDETYQKRQHFVHYQYIPGFGSYGFGLIHLIGNATRSATSLIRQLVDAGTLANLPGGLKARGLRIKGDDTPISPGEFRDVDVASGTVRDNIMPLPYKEPSQTLLALLNQIVDEARRFASTADLKISDMSAQAPVGTTLAILERMLKVMSAVQARVHYSLKQELRLIGGIIRDFTSPEYEYDPDADNGPMAKKDDYRYTDIIPVSDPNAATLSQRVVQYQAAFEMAKTAPQLYNQPYLHRQMLSILGIPNAEKLVELPDDQKPRDPATENMVLLQGKGLKAFAYQDHEAHIQVHQAMMQDPKLMQTLGQNPQAQAMLAGLQAHIAEHAGFAYRAQIESQLGIPLPPLDDDDDAPISKDDEKNLSGLIAAAAQRTLMQNQAMLAQAQQQQQQQDPELALEQQKLALQQQEANRKAQNDQMDFQLGMRRLDLQQQQIGDNKQSAIMKTVVDTHNKAEDRAARVHTDMTRLNNDSGHRTADRRSANQQSILKLLHDTHTKGNLDGNNDGSSSNSPQNQNS